MTTLDLSREGEVLITLRGAPENRILITLRHCPYWLGATFDYDPLDPRRYRAVTLRADRNHEATIREILKRSFGLDFPVEGGDCELPPDPPKAVSHRNRYSRH